MSSRKPFSHGKRILFSILIVGTALLLLAGGWTIPFHFESYSILYKFGKLKIYLRLGKMIGITVVLLILYQTVIASHFKFLEKVYPVKSLLKLHRVNGVVIACLVVTHPLLIKASDNFTPYTFDRKYYPEFAGIGLLILLLSLTGTGVFRSFLKISQKSWFLLHRLGATLFLVLLPSHILFVSDTFKSGLPRTAAITLFILGYFLLLRIWLRRFLVVTT